MSRTPLPKNASLFAAGLKKQIAAKSVIFILLALAAFYIGQFMPSKLFPPFTLISTVPQQLSLLHLVSGEAFKVLPCRKAG